MVEGDTTFMDRLPKVMEGQERARSKSFTLSGRFLKERARLGGFGKARVHQDKLSRRARWRLARAKQRAKVREAQVVEV
jgi:hypothetical protein